MSVLWYERLEIRNQLLVFGRAIQGRSPYDVVIEPDSAKCRSGYCSFDSERIVINPTYFSASEKEQYLLTKALLVHEAAHRRFTNFEKQPETILAVVNILEDERVERLMCEEFIGVRWLIQKLSQKFYTTAESIDITSNSPCDVICYFLQLRWAIRIGQPIKGELSLPNKQLWQEIQPLVFEAWEAETTQIVNRNAMRIVEILGLDQDKSSLKPIDKL